MNPSLASLYQAVDILQDPPPLLIGERCNANGSKAFRDRLLAGDDEGCLRIALDQERGGAHALDLCVAYAGRDETADLVRLTTLFARSVRLPLVIDSTTPSAIEAALRVYPGRALVNSIHLEDGGVTLGRVAETIRRYGAAAIALTIDEQGMAMTLDRKLEVARRIYDLAVHRHGLRPQDLFFDPLTFTVASGDPSLRGSARETLEAVRAISREFPQSHTVLGLSNVSFGLPPDARRILNSVFLHEAVAAGLRAAVVDAAKVLPLDRIPEADRARCLDLLYERDDGTGTLPLNRFLEHIQARAPAAPDAAAAAESAPAADNLFDHVVRGDENGLEDLIAILVRRTPAADLIRQVLIPAMREVGDRFGRGDTLLPFVLQSAGVMKRAVSLLEPHLPRGAETRRGPVILLATVQGDVHDIGKNLVHILLANNGYTVVDLGIKVPAETILAKAKECGANILGLSGLLVKSARRMAESLPQFKAAGLHIPVLLGGAALTRRFVAEQCVPAYDGPVVYCLDAFAGLRAVADYEAGRLVSTTAAPTAPAAASAAEPAAEAAEERLQVVLPPTPPFLGPRRLDAISIDDLLPHLNLESLFRGRWAFRRGKKSEEEYRELIETEARPRLEALIQRARAEHWLEPRLAYGYFRAWREGDTVQVEHEGRRHTLAFPRRASAPRLCLADYFRTADEGGDVAGFFVGTIGRKMAEIAHGLYEANAYRDYLFAHGFGVEMADTVAEYAHALMRRELGLDPQRGARYGFGYSSCPDLEAHRVVLDLVRGGDIGVSVTENLQLVPEETTDAIVVHHPQASYFRV